MKPYYEEHGITIYLGDCREVMPHIVGAESVLTDPPYGLAKRWTGGTWFTRGVYANDRCEWDTPCDAAVTAVLAQGLPSIVWGGNYYALPPARCWLAWLKSNAVPTMADFELAWTNLDRPSKFRVSPCNGWKRSHPTEKPIALIAWCLGFLDGATLDPFMGSGTTLVAAKQLGRRAIGIEIEERYCEIAAKRLAQAVFRFEPAPPPAESGDLFDPLRRRMGGE